MGEKITGYVTLRCGSRFDCLEGNGQDDILSPSHSNSTGSYCKNCHALVMDRIILFNPKPEEILKLLGKEVEK